LKLLRNIHAFTCLLPGLLLLVTTQAVAIDRLKLATQDWPPYQTLEDDVIGGVAVERVKCTLRKMRQPYELHMMSWDTAQLLVESNEMDGFFSGSANTARSKFSIASDPVISEQLSWFINSSAHLDLASESAKYGARYGAKFNTNKWLYLKKNGYNVVKKPRNADKLLDMLWQREIDVALEYVLVFEHLMHLKGIPKDHFKRVPLKKEDLSLHFSKSFIKSKPNFLPTFNRALASCLLGS